MRVDWNPSGPVVDAANLTQFMLERGFDSYPELYAWSVQERGEFWQAVVDRLGIVFQIPPAQILDESGGPEHPRWLVDAQLNIVESCFRRPADELAVVYRRDGELRYVSFGELKAAVDRAAASFTAGEAVAIVMPMSPEAVIAYLGIIKAGGVVVSIADSFSHAEIGMRMRIAGASRAVTQDVIHRGGKTLPMAERVWEAGATATIVVPAGTEMEVGLRPQDQRWDDFLGEGPVAAVPAPPSAPTNILFSSGTTGDPKAIPWTHLTPIKAAMDGHFHQDIKLDDVVCWPTNLGWMMGPWLIYASLINGAAMALFDGAPTEADFGRFVQDAHVTVLGVVPSLVANWRTGASMESFDWSRIRLFSSTGEASNADDMRYLMGLAGGSPVVEYCGGTEIGGAYISGTVVQPAIAATFSTPTLGLALEIVNEDGLPSDDGEVYLMPPSIGLSEELLNRDHHDAYYAGTPRPGLRRHGDHMARLPNGYYRALGRIDDTMNLGGIKISSAELERAVADTPGLKEAAAVAAPRPGGGPDRLVIVAVPEPGVEPDTDAWKAQMQQAIRERLNPLFKLSDVVIADELPRTASNKVMRRHLRSRLSH